MTEPSAVFGFGKTAAKKSLLTSDANRSSSFGANGSPVLAMAETPKKKASKWDPGVRFADAMNDQKPQMMLLPLHT